MARTELTLKVDTKDIMRRMREHMRVVFEAGWDACATALAVGDGPREEYSNAAWLAFEAKLMGEPDTPTAADVLVFLDTFAGQENTAEEVRDFVQLAARFIDEGKPETEWQAHPMLEAFVEWLKEERNGRA